MPAGGCRGLHKLDVGAGSPAGRQGLAAHPTHGPVPVPSSQLCGPGWGERPGLGEAKPWCGKLPAAALGLPSALAGSPRRPRGPPRRCTGPERTRYCQQAALLGSRPRAGIDGRRPRRARPAGLRAATSAAIPEDLWSSCYPRPGGEAGFSAATWFP